MQKAKLLSSKMQLKTSWPSSTVDPWIEMMYGSCFRNEIGAALSYPLTATQLTYDEWEKEIMSPLLPGCAPLSRVLQEHAKGSSFWTIQTPRSGIHASLV
jgi:hypothetical protein